MKTLNDLSCELSRIYAEEIQVNGKQTKFSTHFMLSYRQQLATVLTHLSVTGIAAYFSIFFN